MSAQHNNINMYEHPPFPPPSFSNYIIDNANRFLTIQNFFLFPTFPSKECMMGVEKSISKKKCNFLQLFMYFSYRMNINNNHKCIIFICICFHFVFVYHVGIKLGRQLSSFHILYLFYTLYTWSIVNAG